VQTEHLENTDLEVDELFCKRNSVPLQLTVSQNLVTLTNVKCKCPVKFQSGGSFSSLQTMIVNGAEGLECSIFKTSLLLQEEKKEM